jgi:hypothetical protein
MIVLHCFDNTPAEPGQKHGPLGPTHCLDVGKQGTIEYEYQAEIWVQELETEAPDIVRIECPALNRTWVRTEGKFHEQSRT